MLVDEEHTGRRQKGVLQVKAADELYRKGNEYRRAGNWQEAINCYIAATEIDPQSPAAEAKTMLDDILNFYHKDAYNP